MSPELFKLFYTIAGCISVITVACSIALIFVSMAIKRQEEHSDDARYQHQRTHNGDN